MTEVHARVVGALDSRADVPSDSDSDAPREGRGGDPLLDPEEDSGEEEDDDSEERDDDHRTLAEVLCDVQTTANMIFSQRDVASAETKLRALARVPAGLVSRWSEGKARLVARSREAKRGNVKKFASERARTADLWISQNHSEEEGCFFRNRTFIRNVCSVEEFTSGMSVTHRFLGGPMVCTNVYDCLFMRPALYRLSYRSIHFFQGCQVG